MYRLVNSPIELLWSCKIVGRTYDCIFDAKTFWPQAQGSRDKPLFWQKYIPLSSSSSSSSQNKRPLFCNELLSKTCSSEHRFYSPLKLNQFLHNLSKLSKLKSWRCVINSAINPLILVKLKCQRIEY